MKIRRNSMSDKKQNSDKEKVSRRSFLSIIGWGGLSLSWIAAVFANFSFMKPTVDYGPPKIFRVGSPEDYKDGVKVTYENERVVVVKDKKGFASISLVCTHLGCTVRTSEAGFECPCHGSQFDDEGRVTGGPAPRTLDWYRISLAPNGELEVDKSVKLLEGTYFNV